MNNILFIDDEQELLNNYKELFTKKESSELDNVLDILDIEKTSEDFTYGQD